MQRATISFQTNVYPILNRVPFTALHVMYLLLTIENFHYLNQTPKLCLIQLYFFHSNCFFCDYLMFSSFNCV